nr:A24 family peptidase [uncultured Enterobacter sp.]
MFITSAFLLSYLILCFLLSREDIRTGLLPDRYTCPLLWAGLGWHLCCNPPATLASGVGGAIAGYLSFATLYWGYRWLRGREGMGYGDIKLLAALGAWHGWEPLPHLIFIAALLACLYTGALWIVRRNKQTLKNPLPLGPFLVAAGLIVGWQNGAAVVSLLVV